MGAENGLAVTEEGAKKKRKKKGSFLKSRHISSAYLFDCKRVNLELSCSSEEVL